MIAVSLVAACVTSLARAAIAQSKSSPGPWRVASKVVVDDEAWSWNWGAWDQEKIVSAGDYQYTVYWDADRVFVLVRRDLRNSEVETLRLPDFKLSSDDPHRNTCLGVSLADGRLHLSWDHHNNPLRYARSRPGFLTQPPAHLRAADIEPARPLMSPLALESRVTYPRFLNDANGSLYLMYRLGGSGNGENYLHRYDGAAGAWTRLGKVFDSRGTYAPWNNSTTRNAYLHDLLFDRTNRLHASWVFREAGATWASNHDLHYAYSDDRGLTWRNNAGQKRADLAAGDPLELADAGLVVREIPVYSWLMNTGCLALDSKNRPHVVTFKLPEARRPAKLAHDPPEEIVRQLRFVHYWRSDDGQWRGGEPIADEGARGRLRRGDIVFGRDDTLYFVYSPRDSNEGFRCLQAAAKDQWQDWVSYPLTGPDVTGLDASKHDRRRWLEKGILSFTVKCGRKGFGIVDLVPKTQGDESGLDHLDRRFVGVPTPSRISRQNAGTPR
jgi:hypothetical protein